MSKYIPANVVNACKQGFSAPDASWFKGDSINYVKNLLFSKNTLIYSYLDREAVKSLVLEHLEGKNNRRLLIWSLLNFEWWLRLFL